MPKFTYEAMDAGGRRFVETAEAKDRAAVIMALQTKGGVLIRWRDEGASGKKRFSLSRGSLKPAQRLYFTKDLAHLLKSGVTMDKALTILSRSAVRGGVKSMAESLKAGIRSGSALSDAMAEHPHDFNDLYVSMVRVGETGGILPQVMEKLAQFMERTEEVKRFVISSSIYPAILIMVGLISVVVLMGFVVPRFAEIFRDLGQKIPTSTQILIQTSHLLRNWGWVGILACAAGVVFFGKYRQTKAGKALVDKSLLSFPLFGNLIREVQVSRFARTLGTLVQGGVPILKALTIVRDVVPNSVIQAAITHIHDQVKAGRRISELMAEQPIFPPMVVQMVALGEETGQIGKLLVLVADDLDGRTQNRIRTYLSLLEPVTILFMGLVVGGIILSMLSAIFGINDIEF